MRATWSPALVLVAAACAGPNGFDRTIARRDLDLGTEISTSESVDDLLVRARDLSAMASITLDAGTIEAARLALAEAAQRAPGNGWVEYHAAHLAYVRMTRDLYAPGVEDRDESFERDAQSAVAHAEAALASGVDDSEAAALLGAIHGQRISDSAWLGMTLGPRSSELIERALRSNAENPRAWLVHGISLHFTPALFGGDEKKALRSLERAIALYESAPPPGAPRPSWGHAEAHAWAGQVLVELGRSTDARAHYERAREIAPEYGWVTHVLLPALARE